MGSAEARLSQKGKGDKEDHPEDEVREVLDLQDEEHWAMQAL